MEIGQLGTDILIIVYNKYMKTFEERIEKIFQEMEHFITPYDEKVLIKFFKEELKRITDEIKSKKKVDNKLGSTDLTLGEMFDRGLNSGYTQSINIIKNNLT